MSRYRTRRHPLYTTRFWILTVSCLAIVVAWKYELLPGQAHTHLANDAAHTEHTLPEARVPSNAESAPATQGAAPIAEVAMPTLLDDSPAARRAKESAPVRDGQVTRASFAQSPAAGPALPQMNAQNEMPAGECPSCAEADEPCEQCASKSPVIPAYAERRKEDTQQPIELIAASAAAIDFTEIDALVETGDDVAAHRRLSELYWQHPGQRAQLYSRLDYLARKIYFQPQPHYMEAYVVQPGDVLEGIARRYDVSWHYLAKLNRQEPERVRQGSKLKVIQGPFSAVVDKSDHEITIHAHGYYMCRFPVGLGKDDSTPVGEFVVQEKLTNPTYYGPDGVIAADDPANPLGEYWIDLGDSYGIHGTIDPASIGRDESRGCIRLRNEHVSEVYDLLTVGSKVAIRP